MNYTNMSKRIEACETLQELTEIKSDFGILQNCNTLEAPESTNNEALYDMIQIDIEQKELQLISPTKKKKLLSAHPCYGCASKLTGNCNLCEIYMNR